MTCDPALTEDFTADRRRIDGAQSHTYKAEWQSGRTTFSVDGVTTRVVEQAPDYPMMLILGLFDFPDEPGSPDDVPTLSVEAVTGTDLGAGSLVHAA